MEWLSYGQWIEVYQTHKEIRNVGKKTHSLTVLPIAFPRINHGVIDHPPPIRYHTRSADRRAVPLFSIASLELICRS